MHCKSANMRYLESQTFWDAIIRITTPSDTIKTHCKSATHLENGIHTLPLRVTDRTEPVSSYRTRQKTRDVGNDETEGATARAS